MVPRDLIYCGIIRLNNLESFTIQPLELHELIVTLDQIPVIVPHCKGDDLSWRRKPSR